MDRVLALARSCCDKNKTLPAAPLVVVATALKVAVAMVVEAQARARVVVVRVAAVVAMVEAAADMVTEVVVAASAVAGRSPRRLRSDCRRQAGRRAPPDSP